jgi:hypothetical protein
VILGKVGPLMIEKVYAPVPPVAATCMVPSLKQIDVVVVVSVITGFCASADPVLSRQSKITANR